MPRFKINNFAGLQGTFVVVFIDLNYTERGIPAAESDDLLSSYGILIPGVLRSFYIYDEPLSSAFARIVSTVVCYRRFFGPAD